MVERFLAADIDYPV